MIINKREIKDFENYFACDNGEVYRLINGHEKRIYGWIDSPNKPRHGYVKIGLYKNGKRYIKKLHRIIAETFIDNIENKKEVNHKDGNKRNNNVNNLEWATCKENQNHAFKIGLNKHIGINHNFNKLSEENVINIRINYKIGIARELANKYNVSIQTIYDIIRHKTWKHL